MSSVTIDHPVLGKVSGKHHDGVYQYLGIQYATLKNRLAEPVLRTKYTGGVDASQHGPTAHIAPGGFELEVKTFIQSNIPEPNLQRSDVDCLNLSITIPANATGGKLPVFIWIHGGGNVVGSHSWPQYDHTRLVSLAAENGVPIIGVGINYRLGLQAFITSDELRAAGYKGNNFMRDQRVAFEWVKKHIGGFGGDGENVTVIGESAGSMDISMHLCSQRPLFERAFMTGGTSLGGPALPPPVHESTYQQVFTALGLDKLSAEERIKALLTIPMEEITAKLPPSVQPKAIIDNDILHTAVTHADLASSSSNAVPATKWLKALAIGDCQFDASVLYFLLGHLKPLSPKFADSARVTLASHPEQAERLLSLYNLSSPSTDDDDDSTFLKVIQFVNHSSFFLGTLSWADAFARAGHTNTNVFFFNEPNPWPGKFQGRATHVLDVAFLFQNFNEKLSPAQREAAKQWGLDFARFVSGEKVWAGYTPEQRNAKVYGPSSVSGGVEAVSQVVDVLSKEAGRNSVVVEIADVVGRDTLRAVFVDFLMGKHLK